MTTLLDYSIEFYYHFKENLKYLSTNLRYKGEHDLASALLNYEIALKMFEYGELIQKNPSQKEALIKDFNKEVQRLATDYDQELGTKVIFDIQDEAFSTVSKLKFLRSRVNTILENNFFSLVNGDTKKEISKGKIENRNYIDNVDKSKIEAAKENSELIE